MLEIFGGKAFKVDYTGEIKFNEIALISSIYLQCLCPLFVCDGWEITTVEGLGSTKTQMHTIQSTLSGYGGTQCGYCSPGHIMNMYG